MKIANPANIQWSDSDKAIARLEHVFNEQI
jgi:hypothetical protein